MMIKKDIGFYSMKSGIYEISNRAVTCDVIDSGMP